MKPSHPEIRVNSKAEVDQAINSFKNLISEGNLSSIQIKESFFEIFGSFFHAFQYYEKTLLKALPIYRARPVKDVKDRSNWKNYGAPPKNKDCGIGRANLPCKNVFYGSSSPLGALLETKRANSGEEFYLGRWVFKDDEYVNEQIAVSSFINPSENGDGLWDTLLPDLEELNNSFSKIYGNEKVEIVQYLFFELGKLFSTKDDDYYQITAFLADQIIYNSMENDFRFPSFLLYPSVIDEDNLNIAIHPDFADKFFRLEKVIKIKIVDVANEGIKVIPQQFGLFENDNISFFKQNISLDKRQFLIEKVQCGCGIEIEFDDPEKLNLRCKEDSIHRNLKEICFQLLAKKFPYPDYEGVLDGSFERDGILSSFSQPVSVKIENYELNFNGENHDVFRADCLIIQPFHYTRVEVHK